MSVSLMDGRSIRTSSSSSRIQSDWRTISAEISDVGKVSGRRVARSVFCTSSYIVEYLRPQTINKRIPNSGRSAQEFVIEPFFTQSWLVYTFLPPGTSMDRSTQNVEFPGFWSWYCFYGSLALAWPHLGNLLVRPNPFLQNSHTCS